MVPGETVVVEKVVTETVEVPGETVTVEVVKEVMVPGETVVVEKEVVKTVEVPGKNVCDRPHHRQDGDRAGVWRDTERAWGRRPYWAWLLTPSWAIPP